MEFHLPGIFKVSVWLFSNLEVVLECFKNHVNNSEILISNLLLLYMYFDGLCGEQCISIKFSSYKHEMA